MAYSSQLGAYRRERYLRSAVDAVESRKSEQNSHSEFVQIRELPVKREEAVR